ncbi:unnamed protein product [Orchesella dallaii]|uniref:Membrane-bound transcription factor site-2 protease n=1 Tax=Orchesella dallaii TaxID=48710 RepID=A0ABP1PPU6_9HEXA
MDWKTLVVFTVIFHGIVFALRRQWILRMDTKLFNSTLNGMSSHRIRKYVRVWFRMGTYATIVLGFPFTIWLFLRTIFHAIFPSIVAVAEAVTPTSFFSDDVTSISPPLELHHEKQSPYPEADIIAATSSASQTNGDSSYLTIQPVLPGWNLPLTYLPYYILAIFISVVVHEAGHAVASAAHKIPILSVGVSLFGPLIPTAHVELNSNQLKETQLKKQLDILTAGVWMNIYLALITYFIVPKLLPAFLWPTHSVGNGITVTSVYAGSGVGGPGGLVRGDVITGIEDCPVRDLDSWLTCLENIWEADPVGYCVQNEIVSRLSNNTEGCCGPQGDNSMTHLCFVQVDKPNKPIMPVIETNSILQTALNLTTINTKGNSTETGPVVEEDASPNIPPLPEKMVENHTSAFCLPAKPLVTGEAYGDRDDDDDTLSDNHYFKSHLGRCYAPSYKCESGNSVSSSMPFSEDLNPSESDKAQSEDDTDTHCFLPRLVQQQESEMKRFRVVQIHRRQSTEKQSVLFVGNVWDLVDGDVKTSDFVPRDWFLSKLLGFAKFSVFPRELETVLLLTAGLSAGLAVVNMLPIYGLDGYHIVDAIVHASVSKGWEGRRATRLVKIISYVALAVALLTIFCSVSLSL